MYYPGSVNLVVSFLLMLLTIDVISSKSIDVSEPEPFQKNQVEADVQNGRCQVLQTCDCPICYRVQVETWMALPALAVTDEIGQQAVDSQFSNSPPDEPPSEAELFKYLLTKELLSRHGNIFDWEERQRKRSYWKQCAFNAVSCFGKK